MFVNNETKLTKIFLGDDLLWEDKESVVIHGETVPAKSVDVARLLLPNISAMSDTVYLDGDLFMYSVAKRYSYASPPCSEHGTMILVTLSPTRMTSSNVDGQFVLYETPLSTLIGSDLYANAYKWLTVLILSSLDSTIRCTIDYTRSSSVVRNNCCAAYTFIDSVQPSNVEIIDNTPIVSSNNMVFTPSQKSAGVSRLYILANLYSLIVTEPHNNWTSTKELNSIFNSSLAIYSDSNPDSIDTPEFTLSPDCASDGIHGSDLPSVAIGLTLEYSI
jgi:hypothetical protein